MTLHGSFWVKVQVSKALDIRQLKQIQVSKQGSIYEGTLYAETALWLSCESILWFCVLLTRKVGLKLIKNSWDQIVCQTVAIWPQRESIWTVLCPLTGHQWAPMGTDQIEMLRALHHNVVSILKLLKRDQICSNSSSKCFYRDDQRLIVKYKGTDSGHCVLLKTRFYENDTHLAQSFLKSIVVLYELIKV